MEVVLGNNAWAQPPTRSTEKNYEMSNVWGGLISSSGLPPTDDDDLQLCKYVIQK